MQLICFLPLWKSDKRMLYSDLNPAGELWTFKISSKQTTFTWLHSATEVSFGLFVVWTNSFHSGCPRRVGKSFLDIQQDFLLFSPGLHKSLFIFFYLRFTSSVLDRLTIIYFKVNWKLLNVRDISYSLSALLSFCVLQVFLNTVGKWKFKKQLRIVTFKTTCMLRD